jgi:hypothetical protein
MLALFPQFRFDDFARQISPQRLRQIREKIFVQISHPDWLVR